MALQFIDSFDHYSTSEISLKYNVIAGSPKISLVSMRNGSGCLTGAGSVTKTLSASQQTVGAGIAAYFGAISTKSIIDFYDISSRQVRIMLNTDGTLSVIRGATGTLGTTTYSLTAGVYYFIEFKSTISNTGSYQLYINGNLVLSDTGVDTQATANSYVTSVVCTVASTDFYDDFYIIDGTGSFNNTLLGDIKVECIMPESDGYYTQWEVYPSGDHYAAVNDIPPDSATTYITTSGIGYVDLFGFSNLTTTSGTILGLQVNPFALKDDAGSRAITNIYKIGGLIYSGGTASISNTYTYWPHVQEKSPATLGSWTIAEINSTEFGIRLDT